MAVALAPAGAGGDVVTQEGRVDGNGRFEFAAPGTGQARLSFTPDDTGDTDAPRPFATPPFLI
jgi:hypothetical protein